MAKPMRTLKDPGTEGTIPRARIRHVLWGIHVVPEMNGWQVRGGGRPRIEKQFARKREAVQFAEKLVHEESRPLFIHGRDGKVREKRAF